MWGFFFRINRKMQVIKKIKENLNKDVNGVRICKEVKRYKNTSKKSILVVKWSVV
jgi:hypothetical protein